MKTVNGNSASGELFGGSFRSPGKPQSTKRAGGRKCTVRRSSSAEYDGEQQHGNNDKRECSPGTEIHWAASRAAAEKEMIDAGSIREMIALYAKHGWTLRRVLLSDALRSRLSGEAAELFGEAEVRSSGLDAAWFIRSSRPSSTAWEIRHLSPTPFALVEVIADDIGEEIAEELLRATEQKMIGIIGKRRPAN